MTSLDQCPRSCTSFPAMPVIVVGADTEAGRVVLEALLEPGREVRAFVSDAKVAVELRALGAKVALGDVSDDTHIEGAATNCFSAVLITQAASDGRERAFATSPEKVLEGWARAVAAVAVTRVIWVGTGELPDTKTPETATVDPNDPNLAARVAELDNAREIAKGPSESA